MTEITREAVCPCVRDSFGNCAYHAHQTWQIDRFTARAGEVCLFGPPALRGAPGGGVKGASKELFSQQDNQTQNVSWCTTTDHKIYLFLDPTPLGWPMGVKIGVELTPFGHYDLGRGK